MIALAYLYIIFSLFSNVTLAEKCTYTVPTNGYTTTYEVECDKTTNSGSGTNVPTQSQVYYDPTYFNRINSGQNYIGNYNLNPNPNTIYYTDTNGINYQYSSNSNNQPCICGTMNCQCTNTIYYNPSNGGSSGCYGNDCLTYIILSNKK